MRPRINLTIMQCAPFLAQLVQRWHSGLSKHCLPLRSFQGFTIAELLVTLLILGEIATFTIPKVITAQQNSLARARTKEAVGVLTSAYLQLQNAGPVSTTTKASDLTQYMNYVSVATTGSLVDPVPNGNIIACSASIPCLKLHNGGILLASSEYFNGSTNLNVIQFVFDPDGVYTGLNTDIPGSSIQFELYYNGFITTRGQAKAGSCHSAVCTFTGNAAYDPSWFSW